MNKKDYLNEFQFTESLAESIGAIITKKEDKDFLCFKTIYKLKKHSELVLSSPDPNYNSYGLPGYNGAEVRAVEEKYGHLVEKSIEEQRVPIIIIIEKDLLEILRGKNIEFTKVLLDELKITYTECYNTFFINKIIENFPYLNLFFNRLNNWREEMGRATLDDEIIDKELEEYLSNIESSKENSHIKKKEISHV